MSSAYYIVSESDELQNDLFINGKLFAMYVDKIGVIAEENDLPRPESYVCVPKQDAIEMLQNELGIQADQKTIDSLPEEVWFCPEEGFNYIQSLIALVVKEHCMKESTRKELLESLQEFVKPFECLVQKNCKWHFQIDF